MGGIGQLDMRVEGPKPVMPLSAKSLNISRRIKAAHLPHGPATLFPASLFET
jgi:hypothetical protein